VLVVLVVAALIAAVAVVHVAASSDNGGGKCRTASDCHDHGTCVIAANATQGLCACEERYAGTTHLPLQHRPCRESLTRGVMRCRGKL
jgi:hypothetical protein